MDANQGPETRQELHDVYRGPHINAYGTMCISRTLGLLDARVTIRPVNLNRPKLGDSHAILLSKARSPIDGREPQRVEVAAIE